MSGVKPAHLKRRANGADEGCCRLDYQVPAGRETKDAAEQRRLAQVCRERLSLAASPPTGRVSLRQRAPDLFAISYSSSFSYSLPANHAAMLPLQHRTMCRFLPAARRRFLRNASQLFAAPKLQRSECAVLGCLPALRWSGSQKGSVTVILP